MVIFIYLCILLLNIVAIFMTYKFLGEDFEKKEKSIFLVVGIAIMYMLVSGVYWLSTDKIEMQELSEAIQNFITFTFVPLNAIVILPFAASSFRHYQNGKLRGDKLRNRYILLAIVLIIILIIEFFYFKDIQLGIVNMINSRS